MRILIVAFISLLFSFNNFAQLVHEQIVDNAENGLIIRNTNDKSIRLWVDQNDTRHIGRGNDSRIALGHNRLVGIGTSDPTGGLLHIYKNATTGGWGLINTSNAGVRIQDVNYSMYIDGNSIYSNGGMNIGTFENASLTLGTSDISRLKINGDGKIGIGTVSPLGGLVHIYRNETTGGISSVTTDNAGLRVQDSGASLYIDGNALYTSGNMVLGTLGSRTFSIGTNNVERLRIDENGNVGIGTIDPKTKLHIDGDLRVDGPIYHRGTLKSKEIQVEMDESDWKDYVFEEDYNLPSLYDVEKQIQERGHLKDIPSATDVAQNGINLGEMDAKLLQKIEELTLYMIEINKQIKDIQVQNSKLEKDNKALKSEVSALKSN